MSCITVIYYARKVATRELYIFLFLFYFLFFISPLVFKFSKEERRKNGIRKKKKGTRTAKNKEEEQLKNSARLEGLGVMIIVLISPDPRSSETAGEEEKTSFQR